MAADDLTLAATVIAGQEGFCRWAYQDVSGIWTIGYGFDLRQNRDVLIEHGIKTVSYPSLKATAGYQVSRQSVDFERADITQKQAKAVLGEILIQYQSTAKRVFGYSDKAWTNENANRRAGLISIVYNGLGGSFSGELRAAIRERDWSSAAQVSAVRYRLLRDGIRAKTIPPLLQGKLPAFGSTLCPHAFIGGIAASPPAVTALESGNAVEVSVTASSDRLVAPNTVVDVTATVTNPAVASFQIESGGEILKIPGQGRSQNATVEVTCLSAGSTAIKVMMTGRRTNRTVTPSPQRVLEIPVNCGPAPSEPDQLSCADSLHATAITPSNSGPACSTSWGDPHLVSFDQAAYDFQQVGEFIGAKSTTDDFEIQIRQRPWTTSRMVATNSAVAMRVAGHRVALYLVNSKIVTRVDGKPLEVEADTAGLPGGGTISANGNSQSVVSWPDGSFVTVYNGGSYLTLNVAVAGSRRGHLAGLMGDADSSPANDFRLRSGDVLASPVSQAQLYSIFGTSWRISQSESLFDYAPGETTANYTDTAFPYDSSSVDDIPSRNRAAAQRFCEAAGIVADPYKTACILDVALTGDPSMATAAAFAASFVNSGSVGPVDVRGAVTPGTSMGTAPSRVVSIAEPGQNALFTIDVSDADVAAKKVISVRLSDVGINGVLSILGPNNDGFYGFYGISNGDYVTLPVSAAGTYTIVLDPSGDSTGNLTMKVAR